MKLTRETLKTLLIESLENFGYTKFSDEMTKAGMPWYLSFRNKLVEKYDNVIIKEINTNDATASTSYGNSKFQILVAYFENDRLINVLFEIAEEISNQTDNDLKLLLE